MSESINSITLSGEVIQRPECEKEGEKAVCRLYLRPGPSEDDPPIKVVFFGEKASFCESIKPGDRLALVGKLVLRDWAGPRPEVEVHGRNSVLLAQNREPKEASNEE